MPLDVFLIKDIFLNIRHEWKRKQREAFGIEVNMARC